MMCKRWTPAEDVALSKAVKKHDGKNWKLIAEEVTGRTHFQCLQHWRKVLRPGLIKGHWATREDTLLLQLVGTSKTKNWASIARSIPGRTAKQCRERWSLNLDPTINRGPWSHEEDRLLLNLQGSMGNRWATIAGRMPGRTENAVKTRFKSLTRTKDKIWVPDEDKIIIDAKLGGNTRWLSIAALLPRRSRHAVKKRWEELVAASPELEKLLIERIQNEPKLKNIQNDGNSGVIDSSSVTPAPSFGQHDQTNVSCEQRAGGDVGLNLIGIDAPASSRAVSNINAPLLCNTFASTAAGVANDGNINGHLGYGFHYNINNMKNEYNCNDYHKSESIHGGMNGFFHNVFEVATTTADPAVFVNSCFPVHMPSDSGLTRGSGSFSFSCDNFPQQQSYQEEQQCHQQQQYPKQQYQQQVSQHQYQQPHYVDQTHSVDVDSPQLPPPPHLAPPTTDTRLAVDGIASLDSIYGGDNEKSTSSALAANAYAYASNKMVANSAIALAAQMSHHHQHTHNHNHSYVHHHHHHHVVKNESDVRSHENATPTSGVAQTKSKTTPAGRLLWTEYTEIDPVPTADRNEDRDVTLANTFPNSANDSAVSVEDMRSRMMKKRTSSISSIGWLKDVPADMQEADAWAASDGIFGMFDCLV